MPAFGLDKAVEKAVLKGVRRGAKGAIVKRSGEKIAEEEAAKAAARAAEAEASKVTPKPVDDSVAPVVEDPAAVKPTAPETVVPAIDDEAARIATLDFDQYRLDDTSMPNFDTINTTDDIKAVIADVSEKNKLQIDEARRGVITNEQLQGFADDLDLDQDVVRQIMGRESGGVLNAETILAARQVLNSSADRIVGLAKKITRAEASDLDKLQFRRQLQWHREYQVNFMGARAETGRALNAFRIPAGADEVDISRVRELIDSADGHSTDRIAAAVSMMDNTASVSKAAREYTQSKFMGVVNELFINSILSGPKTHAINTAGNIMMQAMHTAETAVAARIGRFLPGPEHVLFGEAASLVHGTVSAFRDAFRVAAKTMRTGLALDDVVKFESTRRRSISAEHLLTPEQRATPIGQLAEAILDGGKVPVRGKEIPLPGLGQIIRSPTERVMAPTDDFFKTLAYRAEIERQAFVHAYEQVASGAVKAEDAGRVAREFMESLPTKAEQAADNYTRYVTFQNSLGPRGAKVQTALRSMPVTSLLAPFVRTPVNIFMAGVADRSPLALFRSKFWKTMKEGGRERDMMLARVTMGSATTAVVASYAADGAITGAGPSNPDARRVLEQTGWQPYSIRVGDKYHSYARMEPLAFIIGATADAVEIMSYLNSDVDGLEDEQQQANNAVSAIITGVANNTMSKTYLKGIADFTEMLSDPQRYFPGWIRNFATAFVPFSALRSQLGQIDDPYLREAWTTLDALKNKSGIPGWSEEAPPRRDLFGNPRKVYAGSLLGPMSPLPDRQLITDDYVLNTLVALMETTRDVPVVMPSKRVEGLRLNVHEYDQLIMLSRQTPLPATGRTFKDELDRVMGSQVFLEATPDMQVEIIRNVQNVYDRFARAQLYEDNGLFASRLDNFRRKRQELRFGE